MKRSDFNRVVAATVASVAANAATVAGPAGHRIRVGMIGTKHAHAMGQLDTIRQLDQLFELVGVVEPDEERRKQLEGIRLGEGLQWMTEEQLLGTAGLRAVAVETEVRNLLTTAQKCIDAGVHVHLDKPAGASWPGIQNLHRAAEANSLTIQMGYMFRYNPAFRFLFDWIRAGHLGDVFEVHGVISKSVDDATRKELAEFSGGSMFELGCHLIDPLLHLMGPADRVTGVLRNTRPGQDKLADNTLALLEYPKASATIRSTLVEVTGGRRRQFIVCGTQGTIAIRPLEPPRLEMTLDRDRAGRKQGTHTVDLPKSPGRYHGAWVDFAKVINGEKEHEFSHEHDLAVQRTLLTACEMM